MARYIGAEILVDSRCGDGWCCMVVSVCTLCSVVGVAVGGVVDYVWGPSLWFGVFVCSLSIVSLICVP